MKGSLWDALNSYIFHIREFYTKHIKTIETVYIVENTKNKLIVILNVDFAFSGNMSMLESNLKMFIC